MQVVPLPSPRTTACRLLLRYWARKSRAYEYQDQDGNSARRYEKSSTYFYPWIINTMQGLKLDAEPRPPVTTNPTLWKDTFNRRSGTHARISQKVVRSPSASPLLNSGVCARAFSDGDPTICKSRQMI